MHKDYRQRDNLTLAELQNAESIIIRTAQAAAFPDEIKLLKQQKTLPSHSKLLSLDPFFDSQQILRVGGRISKAMIPFASKHPIILPRNNVVTNLIINQCHIENLHIGKQTTLNLLRQKYWPINGKEQVHHLLKQCITCFKANPPKSSYKMGDLPKVRISQTRPFEKTGIDYAGPFYITEKINRNRGKIKCYIAIFVCMASKAVHIEVARDLTTDAFIAILKRFIGRRGLPSQIHSDNATTFRGANNELNELCELFQKQEFHEKVTRFLHKDNIDWQFIPPRAPNFGGLWEAAVKRFKYHFKRVIGD